MVNFWVHLPVVSVKPFRMVRELLEAGERTSIGNNSKQNPIHRTFTFENFPSSYRNSAYITRSLDLLSHDSLSERCY